MRMLTWDEFNSCVESITSSCKNRAFCGVYGFPRGGLCLAVALSHSLNIPLLNQLEPSSLVVDDVYESGKTLSRVLNFPDITTFVWLSKVKPIWWNTVELSDPNEWLVFPWENQERAYLDEKLYRNARGLSK